MANPQTEAALQSMCDWIAAHPKCTRGEIYHGMKLKNTVSESTVYRYLEQIIQRGLITRSGNTSSACYEPTKELRVEMIRKHLNIDHNKRPRVGYNEEFLKDYEPNKTFYLGDADLSRLHARCAPGSAHVSKLNSHDLSMFMCDLSYASSRLEGNEYDYANTIQLAEHHIEMIGGSHRDKVMILNHRDAARYLIDSAREDKNSFGVNQHVLRGVHAILSHDLLKDPLMCGSLRNEHVEIYQSSYIPLDIPDKIHENFTRLTDKAAEIIDPYEQAFFLLVHMPYLQPFTDCNKRTARVACNIPLLMGGVTPISWMDVTNRPREYTDAIVAVYEHNDTTMLSDIFVECFMRSTERFSLLQRMKNPDPVAAKYRTEIKACIRARIIDGVEVATNNVAIEDAAEFISYIDQEIEMMQKNEMLGIRYGISPEMISAWIEENTPNHERMRA